jgi:hypothetical protein
MIIKILEDPYGRFQEFEEQTMPLENLKSMSDKISAFAAKLACHSWIILLIDVFVNLERDVQNFR